MQSVKVLCIKVACLIPGWGIQKRQHMNAWIGGVANRCFCLPHLLSLSLSLSLSVSLLSLLPFLPLSKIIFLNKKERERRRNYNSLKQSIFVCSTDLPFFYSDSFEKLIPHSMRVYREYQLLSNQLERKPMTQFLSITVQYSLLVGICHAQFRQDNVI